MKDTITEGTFIDEMAKPIHGFTKSGAAALFEYFTSLESYGYDTTFQKELVDGEFDPVAFRGAWTEYENFEEILADYDSIKSMDELRDKTQVIEFNDGLNSGIIIMAF
jgi:hypothetical protein